ncbi:RloB domain-containing protein [Streptomyces phaeolivaceus]|uniref:RloB domain-containing protein n=1 Tax=Streptomyces phaeolivaceus TaxID=2653200 RepID=A0A5P8K736_9ACTN|nr:RloB family protein [Streptomyces phaeolivaceus]QFQ99133.1 RloB domain-containing protein [Streptomyces phaeolivaceus]
MARSRGGDRITPKKGGARGRATRDRQVYIYTEGEVTEPEYIDIIVRKGVWGRPDRKVQHHISNENAESKYRKPYRMVQEAVRTRIKAEREARSAGLRPYEVLPDGTEEGDWNWPQVWVVFDRDDHLSIPEAMSLADDEGIHVAYSHPCFELWRLLHYTNYTSTFGGVCGDANSRLRSRPGFAATYGPGVQRVSEQESKHLREDQVLSEDGHRYESARKYAKKINEYHSSRNPNAWDPYTNVWCLVEQGLLLGGY